MNTRRGLLLVLLTLSLSLVPGCSGQQPAEVAKPDTYEVTLEVEGTTSEAKVSLYTPENRSNQWQDVKLPYKRVETIPSDWNVMLNAAHVEGGKGELKLSIFVNGKLAKTVSTSDPNQFANAQIGLSKLDPSEFTQKN